MEEVDQRFLNWFCNYVLNIFVWRKNIEVLSNKIRHCHSSKYSSRVLYQSNQGLNRELYILNPNIYILQTYCLNSVSCAKVSSINFKLHFSLIWKKLKSCDCNRTCTLCKATLIKWRRILTRVNLYNQNIGINSLEQLIACVQAWKYRKYWKIGIFTFRIFGMNNLNLFFHNFSKISIAFEFSVFSCKLGDFFSMLKETFVLYRKLLAVFEMQ